MIYQRLADANPTATTFRRDLAVNFNNIGIIQSAIGRNAEALRIVRAGHSLYQALTDANPSTPAFRSGLADCSLKIGYQQTLDGHHPKRFGRSAWHRIFTAGAGRRETGCHRIPSRPRRVPQQSRRTAQ